MAASTIFTSRGARVEFVTVPSTYIMDSSSLLRDAIVQAQSQTKLTIAEPSGDVGCTGWGYWEVRVPPNDTGNGGKWKTAALFLVSKTNDARVIVASVPRLRMWNEALGAGPGDVLNAVLSWVFEHDDIKEVLVECQVKDSSNDSDELAKCLGCEVDPSAFVTLTREAYRAQRAAEYAQSGIHEEHDLTEMLETQAIMVWPREREFIQSYFLGDNPHILDIGCGVGAITLRLAEMFPNATIVGVDLEESHIVKCRYRLAQSNTILNKSRVSFVVGDAYTLANIESNRFSLVTARSMLYAVQHPDRVVTQALRVCKPGGVVHFLCEDYGAVIGHPLPEGLDLDQLWQNVVIPVLRKTGSNGRMGRSIYHLVRKCGAAALADSRNSSGDKTSMEVKLKCVDIDSTNTPRHLLAKMFSTWRDGYADWLSHNSGLSNDKVLALWNGLISLCGDEDGYVSWRIFVCSAIKPFTSG